MNDRPKTYLCCIAALIFFMTTIKLAASNDQNDLETFSQMKLEAGKLLQANRRDSILMLGEKMVSIAERIGRDSLMAWAYFYYAEGLLRKNPKEGLSYMKRASDLYERLGMKLHAINCINSIGNYYQVLHEYDTSIQYYNKVVEAYLDPALEVSDEKRRKRLGIFYYNLGFTSLKNAQYVPALEYLIKADSIADQLEYPQLSISIWNIMGGVYFETGKSSEALKYYRRSQELAREKKLDGMLGVGYNNLALIFRESNQPDSALHYLEKSYVIAEKMGDNLSMSKNMGNRAVILAEGGQYKDALQLNYDLLELVRHIGERSLEATALGNISECYSKMGQFDRAIAPAQEGLKIGEEANDIDILADLSHNLYLAYSGKEDHKNALQAYIRYESYRDSMLNEDNLAKIDELRERFEAAEKEAAINELKKQNRLQELEQKQERFFFIGSLIIAGLFMGLIYFFFRQRRMQLLQQSQQVEQRLLRSQMNPHFFFNALTSIQRYLFEKEDTRIAVRYLAKLAKLMRQILENSRETYITLGEEIKTLENYLSLQQLRYEDRFHYQIEIGPGINLEEILIPPMIAQPFVENAIEHGQLHQLESGAIHIRFAIEEGRLLLEIEDNGVGRRVAELSQVTAKHESLATIITRERLNLLKRLTREKCTFQIMDLPDQGTKVAFSFPLLDAA